MMRRLLYYNNNNDDDFIGNNNRDNYYNNSNSASALESDWLHLWETIIIIEFYRISPLPQKQKLNFNREQVMMIQVSSSISSTR
mmetsp:Transcript_39506/g.55668  ORF Transcript_39506/g.55668 Transcript_39506/m.55668 type:complete len:84 (-) Transcript_39506:50-301(-)